jgi:periplasmic protein TonB
MKLALPVSFGAALFCHALVLFGFGLQTGPSVGSTDSGAGAMGLELLGASDGPSLPNGDGAQNAEPNPTPDEIQPANATPPEPEPSPITPKSDTFSEAPSPIPSATPPPARPVASHKGGTKAATATKASGTSDGKASGGGNQRGGMGTQGTGWDTEARPAYRHNPTPVYPPAALHARRQGTVLIRVEVSADGNPLNVKLSQSCGFPDLDESALQAVRRWRFEPARLAGMPVTSRVEVPVAFNLIRKN